MLGEKTHADKRINSIHFGSDPADIWIRIRINPNSNRDQILALAEFAVSGCSCLFLYPTLHTLTRYVMCRYLSVRRLAL